MTHLELETLSRRLHAHNTTPKTFRGLTTILKARWMLTKALIEALQRSKTTPQPA